MNSGSRFSDGPYPIDCSSASAPGDPVRNLAASFKLLAGVCACVFGWLGEKLHVNSISVNHFQSTARRSLNTTLVLLPSSLLTSSVTISEMFSPSLSLSPFSKKSANENNDSAASIRFTAEETVGSMNVLRFRQPIYQVLP